MLSKCENDVMNAVYNLCDGTDGCLVTCAEILSVLPAGRKYTHEHVSRALNNLCSDGYFDLISSSRSGEKIFVISLKDSGLNFKRAKKQKALDVAYKIGLAFIGAFATFIFGIILKAIAGG